jgi:hypothetical protein
VAPYVPRAAADTVLHGVVQEHLETFLAAAAACTDGIGLPHFIERELRAVHPERAGDPARRLGRPRAVPELGPDARRSLALLPDA